MLWLGRVQDHSCHHTLSGSISFFFSFFFYSSLSFLSLPSSFGRRISSCSNCSAALPSPIYLMKFHEHLLITLCYGVLSAAATPWPVARETGIQSMPRPTPPPHPELSKNKLLRRQFDMDLTTCGYSNGNPTLPITAVKGFQCRIDIENGLWGFCSADVQAASDCSFVGQCFDTHTCERGCGKTDGSSGIISTTW